MIGVLDNDLLKKYVKIVFEASDNSNRIERLAQLLRITDRNHTIKEDFERVTLILENCGVAPDQVLSPLIKKLNQSNRRKQNQKLTQCLYCYKFFHDFETAQDKVALLHKPKTFPYLAHVCHAKHFSTLFQASALYGDRELIDFILNVINSKNNFLKEALIEFFAVFPHDKLILITPTRKIFKKAKKITPDILKHYIDESLKNCNATDQLSLIFKLIKGMNGPFPRTKSILSNSPMILTSPSINLDQALPQLITKLEMNPLIRKWLSISAA